MHEGDGTECDAPPTIIVDPAAIDSLRRALRRAGYTLQAVRSLLPELDENLRLRPSRLAWWTCGRRPDGTALDTLARLFLLNVRVGAEEAADALAPLSLGEAKRIGAVALRGDQVEACVRIVPTPWGLNLASDMGGDGPDAARQDFVMGVTPSTKMAASLSWWRPVARAADIGSGCGPLAILAARNSSRVIATEVNRRAASFTAVNAHLNGVADRIEQRSGSFFEPLAGEGLDLVVHNPPYAISPGGEPAYRQAGLPRDTLLRTLIQHAPTVLRRGGTYHVVGNWVLDEGQPWWEPVEAWTADLPCDAMLVHHGDRDRERYAADWNFGLESRPGRYLHEQRRWVDHLKREGIDRIALGAVVLRRTDRPARVRRFDLRGRRVREAPAHLDRLMRASAGSVDSRARVQLVDGVLVEQRRRQHAGVLAADSLEVSLHDGLPIALTAEGPDMAALEAFAGGASADEAAARAGTDVAQPLSLARRLVDHGFATLSGRKLRCPCG